jgi:hypothetical protein
MAPSASVHAAAVPGPEHAASRRSWPARSASSAGHSLGRPASTTRCRCIGSRRTSPTPPAGARTQSRPRTTCSPSPFITLCLTSRWRRWPRRSSRSDARRRIGAGLGPTADHWTVWRAATGPTAGTRTSQTTLHRGSADPPAPGGDSPAPLRPRSQWNPGLRRGLLLHLPGRWACRRGDNRGGHQVRCLTPELQLAMSRTRMTTTTCSLWRRCSEWIHLHPSIADRRAVRAGDADARIRGRRGRGPQHRAIAGRVACICQLRRHALQCATSTERSGSGCRRCRRTPRW